MADITAQYITHSGDDLLVVNAARVSFDKQSQYELVGIELQYDQDTKVLGTSDMYKLADKDAKLLRYLAKHQHWTPFSHPQITIRETVPIFVARERFRHTIGFSYNEVSRRYVDDTPEFYTPEYWRGRPQGSVKQGSSQEIIDITEYCEDWCAHSPYQHAVSTCLDMYHTMLMKGVAPEMARMVLPQSMMTSYYVTGSLAAWARMYKLRSAPSAQKEIQDLAFLVHEIIEPLYPVSWSVLTE